MTTYTAVAAGTGADLAKATVEVLYAPQGYGFRRSLGLWTGGKTGTGTAEILSREMSGGIGSLGQPVIRHFPIPVYEGAAVPHLLPRGAEAPDDRVYVVDVRGGTGGGVGPVSTTALPNMFPGAYYLLGYAEELMGGSLGLSQDLPAWGYPSDPKLLVQNKYVRDAVGEFKRLNKLDLRASRRIFGAVVEILNHSVRRGYHPIATVDETDYSLEIEARLNPNHLLLLQVWPSGATEGLIFSDREGFKSLEPTTVSGVVDWLGSSDHPEEPGPAVLR